MATNGKMSNYKGSLKAAYQKFLPQLQNDTSEEEASVITLHVSPDVNDEVTNPPTLESNKSSNIQHLPVCSIRPSPTTVETDPRSFQAIRNRKYRNSFCSDNVFTDETERDDEEMDNSTSCTLEPDNNADGPSSPERLGASNKGHNMLMKMGWSGEGGVGKNEDGIVDPIVLVTSKNRGGLGHANQDDEEPQKKKQKIKKETRRSRKKTNSCGIANRTTRDFVIQKLLKYLSLLGGTDRNAKEILKSSCDSANLSLEVRHVSNNESYCYGIYIHGTLLSLGYGRGIEEAKSLAFQNTLAAITAKQTAQEPPKPVESKQDNKCSADNENCSSVADCNSTNLPIPNFILIILNLGDTKNTENVPLESDIVPLDCQNFLDNVGIAVMSIIESCRCSKSAFHFKTQDNNPNEVTLTIKENVVALGVGETFRDARLDAATKALNVLKEKQTVVVNKSIKDIFLCKNEVISGLWLSYGYDKAASEKRFGYDYEVINSSCAKCNLDVDWYSIPPKLHHGKASWSTILVIGSKIVGVATHKTKKKSMKLCSKLSLSFLQKMVELNMC